MILYIFFKLIWYDQTIANKCNPIYIYVNTKCVVRIETVYSTRYNMNEYYIYILLLYLKYKISY